MQEKGWGFVEVACVALGQLGDKRAVEPLKAVMRHPEQQVREAAKQALTQLGYRGGFWSWLGR